MQTCGNRNSNKDASNFKAYLTKANIQTHFAQAGLVNLKTYLTQTNLTWANNETHFAQADIKTNLTQTNLTQANLTKANTETHFAQADLKTNLTQTILTQANIQTHFAQADLKTNLTQTCLVLNQWTLKRLAKRSVDVMRGRNNYARLSILCCMFTCVCSERLLLWAQTEITCVHWVKLVELNAASLKYYIIPNCFLFDTFHACISLCFTLWSGTMAPPAMPNPGKISSNESTGGCVVINSIALPGPVLSKKIGWQIGTAAPPLLVS